MQYKVVNFRADRISGWLHDPEADGTKPVVDVFVGNEAIAALRCEIFRQELPVEDFPSRNIGFLGALPPVLWTGETYDVSLRDRRTGRVLVEHALQTQDFRLRGAPGFSGQMQLTQRGEIGGWAAQENSKVNIRVLVDGHQVDDRRANHKKVLWGADRVHITAPPEFAYSFQLPSEYFDDGTHTVQVIADPDAEDLLLLDETLRFESKFAEQAVQETERLRMGKRDWSQTWQGEARQHESLRTTRIELTPSYAAVTLRGALSHKRVVLRIADSVIPLVRVESLHPDDQAGQSSSDLGRYAGEIPSSVSMPSSVGLHSAGLDMTDTYEIRMGDESGRRPRDLPTYMSTDDVGYRVVSPVVWEAATLKGWIFDTADLAAPIDVVLRVVTPEETVELERKPASVARSEIAQLYGVTRTGGYRLQLPKLVLQDKPVHLQLVASDDVSEKVLWEENHFQPNDEWLLNQILTTTSSSRAVSLVRRVRAAGREQVVDDFLTRRKQAVADLQLKDLEAALTKKTDTRNERLKRTGGAIWYWVSELRSNPGRVQWFTQNAVRNRMGDARDVLAYAASKGRFDFSRLHGLLESSRAELFGKKAQQEILRDKWTSALLCLARYLYSAPRDETDRLDALTLYRLLEEDQTLESIRGTDRSFYGELLTWRGDFAHASYVLSANDSDPAHDYSQQLLALNTVNPAINGGNGSTESWVSGLNALLSIHGIAPIRLAGDQLSFYQLTADLTSTKVPVESGPLVSVIMPIYEPSAATDIAMKSLMGQTWRNLEIIVIDDCSPAIDDNGNSTGYREQLESFAAADDRVRLVFAETNRGSYSVRNDALDLATGEFVTVADKDDWHHPEQIELQVRHLQQNPDHVANMTNWARVDENLRLVLRSSTGRVMYPSMPSLMFRRQQVLEDLGYWDTVRKSGDSEYKSRMENYFGAPIEVVCQAPMAFALMEGQNLTRDDMGVGYLAPDRRTYLRAYKRWHREIREDAVSPYMSKGPDQRRFAAPPEYLPHRQQESTSYDVVFASEFGFVAGNSTSLFTEISVCLKAGLKVGVIPFQNGLIPSAAKRQFNRKIDELVLSGQVDRLSLDTAAETDLLIVRWPTALQAVRDEQALLNPKRAVVVANHPPFEPGGRRSYDIGVVTRNIERLFGVRPTWAPQSEQIGAMLEPLMPASDLEDFSWKGIIEVKDSAHRNRYHSGTPVIGRHGRDDPAKWPSNRSIFRSVYPMDDSINVCILGGANVPQKRGFLPRNARNWEVFAFNEITVDEYLAEKLDFFVYFHSDDWVEAFGMAILEAMSYGVVCILPRHFQPVFGEAAVYADPSQVQTLIQKLWDPDHYQEQQQKALRFIEVQCTSSAYLGRIASLGVMETV